MLRISAYLRAALTLILIPAAHADVPYLVRDINTSSWARSSDPATFHEAGGKLFFTADHAEFGRELWKFEAGVASLVGDVFPYSNSSVPSAVEDLGGGVLLFFAHDGTGRELWRTDGTPGGTYRVKDINPSGTGVPNSIIRTVYGNKLYFIGNDGVHGSEPWYSNGTSAGTQMLLNLNGTSASSTITNFAVLNGRLLIFANGSLWDSDGTPEGTSSIASIGDGVFGSVQIGSTLFFASNGGGMGRELWKTNGTASGTMMVKDIAAGATSGVPGVPRLAAVGGTLYFGATSSGAGMELWKSNGETAGTERVRTLLAEGSPSAFTLVVAGSLIFVELNGSLWRSDGTEAGTYVIDTGISEVVSAFGRAYYFRQGDEWELWTTDGAAKTKVASLGSTKPSDLAVAGGKLYFGAETPLHGKEPWVSDDGITARNFANVNPDTMGSSSPRKLTAAGGLVFFTTGDGPDSGNLWRSDGSSAGTVALTSVSSPAIDELTGWNGTAYFRFGTQFWRSGGTPGSTGEVRAGLTEISHLFASEDALFFNARLPDTSLSLFRTNGTADGTVEVSATPARAFADLAGRTYVLRQDGGIDVLIEGGALARRLVSGSRFVEVGWELEAAAGLIFFTARTAESGPALWSTDGAPGGEMLVRQFVSASPRLLTSAGRFLYFVASDGTHGEELWRSDGTAGGTILLRDIRAGTGGSDIQHLTAAGDLVYFTADDGTNGIELWRSDGTPGGTVMVADIWPGVGSSEPQALQYVNGTLWFAADDGTTGAELWRVSGGVAARVADLEPGGASSAPDHLTVSGQRLFFSARTASEGRELWAVNLSGSTVSIGDVRVVEGSGGTRIARFGLIRAGDVSGEASVAFATQNGSAVAGSDYTARSGRVSFAAGQSSQFIDVSVLSDEVVEGEERFFVLLSAPIGTSLGKTLGVAVIQDDDGYAELSVEVLDEALDSPVRRFRITNSGPREATDLHVTVSESPGDFSLDLALLGSAILHSCSGGNPSTCVINGIAAGDSVTISAWRSSGLSGYVDPSMTPGQTFTVSVLASEPEEDLTDNRASRLFARTGRVALPPFLVHDQTASALFLLQSPATSPLAARLSSTSLNIHVIEPYVTIPTGEQTATFTMNVGFQSGPVLLLGGLTEPGTDPVVVHVVAPGATPRLDVEIVTEWSSVTYGSAATIPVHVAARRHDGVKPSGVVKLLDSNQVVLAQQSLDSNGKTTFTRSGLPVGTTTFRIRYEGDASFSPLDGATAQIFVRGYATSVVVDAPPMLCAGVQQQIPIFVRTTETTSAPTGSVRMSVGGSVVATLSLSPTGKPGESRAFLLWTFSHSLDSMYIAATYLPTGGFGNSNGGSHFKSLTCVPINLSAIATSTTSVSLSWTGNGAASYEILRMSRRDHWESLGQTAATTFADLTVAATRAYLYTVRAIDAGGNTIGFAPPDVATTILFQDDPLVARVTPAKAVHLRQLREAANELRWLATSARLTLVHVPVGATIMAMDVVALRDEISTLRRSLGLPAAAFTDPALAKGMAIKAAHVQELRTAVK